MDDQQNVVVGLGVDRLESPNLEFETSVILPIHQGLVTPSLPIRNVRVAVFMTCSA
jgi:hypothetical protein